MAVVYQHCDLSRFFFWLRRYLIYFLQFYLVIMIWNPVSPYYILYLVYSCHSMIHPIPYFYHQISMAVNRGNVKAWIIKKWSARPPRQTLHSGLNLKFVMWSGQYEKNAQRKRRNAHLHSCEWDFFGSIQLSHFEWKQSSSSSIWTGRESEEIRVFDFDFNVWNVN